jgi:NADPH2:quinone reductase
MRALELVAYDGRPESVTVVDRPDPRPGPGQVLVKVAASPVNPSDLAFLNGLYGFTKPLPTIPGFEGSGTVVDAGPGLMGSYLKGKRVSCTAADPKISGGMWAQYVVTSAQLCIPLSKEVSLDQGAMMLVNPITAWAMVEEARRANDRAIVQTAAASALGRMVIRLCKRFQIPVINIVRRPEQVDLLKREGSEHVLNSEDPNFDAALRELARRLGATLGLDAVAGELSARVLRAQPKNSRLMLYGALSMAAVQIEPGALIFEGKKVMGFWLSAWLARQSFLSKLRLSRRIQGLLATDLKSEIRAKVPLHQAKDAIQQYARNMTAGKILITP